MNSSQAKALVYYMFAALGGNVKAQMALVIINNFSIINENTTLPGPVYLYEVSPPG